MPENKYLKKLPGRILERGSLDVYDVLVAFGVTCPATAHAVKKLLCPGQRGAKDNATDLREAGVSIERAIQLATDTTDEKPVAGIIYPVEPLDIPSPVPRGVDYL